MKYIKLTNDQEDDDLRTELLEEGETQFANLNIIAKDLNSSEMQKKLQRFKNVITRDHAKLYATWTFHMATLTHRVSS